MNHFFFRKLKTKSILVFALTLLVVTAVQLAATPAWIGNVIGSSTPANFATYWNQVTSENAGKWGSVESSRDSMNWSSVDSHVNYARGQGMPYKFHVLVWGQQQPGWIGSLSASEQLAEITEWIQAVGSRYSPDAIDVVNEPLHAVPNYSGALGGNGSTGWDWVIKAFELAKQYCSGKLLINEYGVENDSAAMDRYITIINLLKSRGLVDGVGIQCHQFNLDTLANSTFQSNLSKLAAVGLPIYASELDLTGDDTTQANRYKEKFPILYNHSSIVGITLWGYIQGQTWKENTHLVSSGSVGASERPAMVYLKPFLRQSTGPTATPTRTATPIPTPTPTRTATMPPTSQPGNGDGLYGEYYTGTSFETLTKSQVDSVVNFDWVSGSPSGMPVDNFSVRWTGKIEARMTATYTITTRADDGTRVWINNQQIINNWVTQAATDVSGTYAMTMGTQYDITVEYFEGTGEASMQLYWSNPNLAREIIPQSQLYSGGVQPTELGDVNNDSTINIVDALMTAQYYVDLDPAGFDASRADVNCDGSINIVDALIIAQYSVGLISNFC